jgi:exonuclease SbcD
VRLLHTSDWHLGRSLYRADLRAAQGAFLDQLVATVQSEKIDVVLVAGDVYDRAVPSVDAVALCEDGLVRLRDAGARAVLISGNHDSARRLGFGSRLVDAAGVHLRTRAAVIAEPVLLEDVHGPVAVYGVPYLEPDAVRTDLPPCPGGADGDALAHGHAGVLGRATGCIRAHAAAGGPARSVVLAHGWVAGGAGSDSERDITVGGVGSVPTALFDGFTYVALGHLHRQQTLDEHLRYSGSPLPYSFSEASDRKGAWLVELDAAGLIRVEHVPAPSFRRLAALRGPLDELLTSTAYAEQEGDFLSVVLTDPTRPEGAMDRLRSRFPHVLVLAWEPDAVVDDPRSYRARVQGRDDLTVAAEFVGHVRRLPATDVERATLAAALEAVRCGAEVELCGDPGSVVTSLGHDVGVG